MDRNHLDLIEKFREFNSGKHLGSSALLIYLFLLNEVLTRNSLLFSISDVKLSRELNLTRKTIKTNREILENNGLIECEIRNGSPCKYQIVTDYNSEKRTEEVKYEIIVPVQKEGFNSGSSQKKITKNDHAKNISKGNHDKIRSTKSNTDNIEIPTLEEFLEFTGSLKSYESFLMKDIELKYSEWLIRGWKNNLNRPITDWKSTIKNILPYLKNSSRTTINLKQSLQEIKRPKLPDF